MVAILDFLIFPLKIAKIDQKVIVLKCKTSFKKAIIFIEKVEIQILEETGLS